MKLMIVDDHVLFREGLAAIIRPEADIEIVGLAGSVKEAIEIAARVEPDLILMDFNLPDGSGVDATRAILADHPGRKIIFLTVYEEDENLFAAIRAGAKGYLLKNMHPAKLISALRSVQQGEGALSRAMMARVMQEMARSQTPEQPAVGPLAKLTPRELEVLREIASGASNDEISKSLYLSENTVKHHLHSIFDKLNLGDRRSAAKFAREHGLVK